MAESGKALSIKDLAAISGVSIATVSRVLNKKGGYSEETERRVMAVADTYGYVSNMAAKTLREARSHTVGLIVPNINNLFFSQLAYFIETDLFEHNYSVFICNSSTDAEKERAYLRTLASKRVDGILDISCLEEFPDVQPICDIPIVLIDRDPQHVRKHPVVHTNDAEAARAATELLLSRGCRHIVHIGTYLAEYDMRERARGYAQALEAHGILLDKNYILQRTGQDPSHIETEIMVYDFLKKGYPVDGIHATSERAAIGALYALKRFGLRVPQDVKIVCYDNTLYSLLTSPTLTSVERHPEQMAHTACELLLKMIDGETVSGEYIVPFDIVQRASTV